VHRVQCGGLIVRGKLKGSVVSRGPVLVGPEAEIKGDVTAPALAVGAGANPRRQVRDRQEDRRQPSRRPVNGSSPSSRVHPKEFCVPRIFGSARAARQSAQTRSARLRLGVWEQLGSF
jgi:cytoskeletal protein CcmA (bactofilin family)